MNIKELAIQGLLQKHGKAHLYETCPELINELVELGEEIAPLGKIEEVGDHKVTTFPWSPNSIWCNAIDHHPDIIYSKAEWEREFLGDFKEDDLRND